MRLIVFMKTLNQKNRKKEVKVLTYENPDRFLKGRQNAINRLPIVNAGNTSENMLNKICLIIYSIYQAKEITRNAYKNMMMNSITVWYKTATIFINSKNTKTSNLHRLLLNLSNKIILKGVDKYVHLSNLNIYFT